ncbi:MAG: hypothetical protein VYE50_00980 [Candidatus Thermoplasmatota archaeon]|nr:hypothetical protein [Candidatus Thermoplasmatota archaeon]MEC8996914.1 hypothetical protein [Candidatus Thermoplasmatota archaeon]
MTEEESKEIDAISWILTNMPLVAMFEGLFLILIGLIFYLFPEDKQSATALIPSFIGLGLLIPGFLAYTNENMKMHAMHVAILVSLIGTLGGAMGLPDLIAGNFDRATIARLILLIICGEYMFLSIMSFRQARIKRA